MNSMVSPAITRPSATQPSRLARVFLRELARLGPMHQVAEQLSVTTSTVSQQIAALSRDLGSSLIQPDGRRVRLTPAGRRLADMPSPSWRRSTPHGSISIRTPNRPAPCALPASPPPSAGRCCRSTRQWPCGTPGSDC